MFAALGGRETGRDGQSPMNLVFLDFCLVEDTKDDKIAGREKNKPKNKSIIYCETIFRGGDHEATWIPT